MHNEDVVDLLWTKLNNAELAMFVASIKVDYHRNHQKCIDILQEIATQIPTGKRHHSQLMGYRKLIREETITAIHSLALQKENICLMVESTPDHIHTSSGWFNQLPHTMTWFVQARKSDGASINQTTIRKVCNKKKKLPNSAVGNQPILCYINCPMFGFQSLSSTVWYHIHKGIIWTSTLRILLSLFDIPSLFDTSSLIDIFLRLSPIYWLVCLQRRENYSQLSFNLFHPYSTY